MANADLERFRLKLREYRLLVNRNQGDLAAYLNLDYSELSNRLNGHKNARLSHENIRAMIRALAEWGAITTQSQADELLDLMLCSHFDQVDLQARPLSKLIVAQPLPSTPTLQSQIAPTTKMVQKPVRGLSNTLPLVQANPNSHPAQLDIPPASPLHGHNLPYTLITLLGREEEIVQLVELLAQKDTHHRLVTMTGAGGSGKTSLALEVGKQLLPAFAGGVYFVELEHLTDQEGLISQIAQTLKVNETPGQNLWSSLKESFKEKELLLILDNFEQLVSEAGILKELLKETRFVKLLVTSRIPLHLTFEREFPIPPLALPDNEALNRLTPGQIAASYPGVALFLERGQAVKSDFGLTFENIQSVVEICRRLDGLPLALELAAARVRTFSPHKLLERLSLKVLTGGATDLPARQRTLRDTIEWSYDLLSEREKRFFARLTIFVGGCTLEAAETVCNPAGELGLEVFEEIEALLTRNLLKQEEGVNGETRYGMLVTIREFGLEKLGQRGEFELLEQRFTAYYRSLSRQLGPGIGGSDSQSPKRLGQVESEYINLRAALYQSLTSGQSDEALELSVTLSDYINSRGYWSEGLAFLKGSLALPFSTDSFLSRTLRSRALFWTGVIYGDYTHSHHYFEQALALQREIDDKRGIIYSINRLSEFNRIQGNFEESDRLLVESLALSRELGEEGPIENTRTHLAMAAFNQEKYTEARHYLEQSLAIYKSSGNELGKTHTIVLLGLINQIQGKYNEARDNLEQSLVLYRKFGITWGIVWCVNHLGRLALIQEEYSRAHAFIAEGLMVSQKYRFKLGIALSMETQGLMALGEGDYQKARTNLEESLASYRESGNNQDLAKNLPFLGLTAAYQGEDEDARAFYAEALVLNNKLRNRLHLASTLTGLAGMWLQDWLKSEQKDSLSSLTILGQVVRLAGVTSALVTSIQAVMFRPFPDLYENNLKIVRVNLDEATFETLFREGQAMSMDEAVALAYVLSV